MRVIEPVAYLGQDFVSKLKRIADEREKVVGLRAIIDSPAPPVVDRNEAVGRIRVCKRIIGEQYFLLMTLTGNRERTRRAIDAYYCIPEVAGLCIYPWDTGQFGCRTRTDLHWTFDILNREQYSGPLIIHGGSAGGTTSMGLRACVGSDIAEWLMRQHEKRFRAHVHFPHRWALDDPEIACVRVSASHGVSLRQYVASPDEGGTWIEGWYDASDALEGYIRQKLHADGQPLWASLYEQLEERIGHAKAEGMVFAEPFRAYQEKLKVLL